MLRRAGLQPAGSAHGGHRRHSGRYWRLLDSHRHPHATQPLPSGLPHMWRDMVGCMLRRLLIQAARTYRQVGAAVVLAALLCSWHGLPSVLLCLVRSCPRIMVHKARNGNKGHGVCQVSVAALSARRGRLLGEVPDKLEQPACFVCFLESGRQFKRFAPPALARAPKPGVSGQDGVMSR